MCFRTKNNENKKKDKMIKKLTTKLQINNYNTNNNIINTLII